MSRLTDRAPRARALPIHLLPLRILFLTATLLSALIACAAARAAAAPDDGIPKPMSLDDVRSGTLLLRTTTPGRFIPAPLVMTEAHMRVAGMIARVELRQRFYNPSKDWLEGVYAFPLPENAAVDRMRLEVGDHVIEARIAERQAARRAYETARAQGRRAALLEQHRPNIFTNAVANIAPGGTVTVTLRYQQTLRYADGRFTLRLPMVVAPRYRPGPLHVVRTGPDGWATGSQLPGQDAPSPDPMVLPPALGPVNPVAIKVALDAGVKLAALDSPYHAIRIAGPWHDGKATVTLDNGAVPADRDFVLRWTPATGAAPVAGAFRETIGDDTYFVAMVLPPQVASAPVPPRDVVFVLDRSGSMGGRSILQARSAIADALARLRPEDRLDVIRFDDRYDALFGAMRPATSDNLAAARAYVESTEARGGTEMMAPLMAALSTTAPPGRLRQVVFLTDGAVDNETALLSAIEAHLGNTRLFTVGIGSAPNSWFMTEAARVGRGSFTYIGKLDEVGARMAELFARLARPAMTDIAASWTTGGGMIAAAAYPARPGDLYHGEPLLLAARLPTAEADVPDATLHLTGISGNVQWRHDLLLAGAAKAPGIGAVWGRARIADLMGSLRRGADQAAVREAVIRTALRHSLVSAYTSLVAVDDVMARPADAPTIRRMAPINLPAGWDYDRLFGEVLMKRGFGAAPAPAGGRADAKAAFAVASTSLQRAGATPVILPQTATGWRFDLLLGLGALALAAGTLAWARRRA